MTHKTTVFFSKFHYLCLVAVLALGLITIVGSNGGDGDSVTPTQDTTPPTVSSTTPANNATDVAVDMTITSTFSEEMDSSTITIDTFTVNDGSSNIAGTVTYSGTTATFTQTDNLENNNEYTATITTGAKDSAGNSLEANYTWSFTTVAGPTTFNSGGTIGDLLTYTIDTNTSPMTYSYEIAESDFGLTGTTGSGTLTQNADGTYTPSNDPEASVILLANTLIVGGADIDVGGTETTMLFAGVPALTTDYTADEIAGTYNYIVFSCDDPLVNGVCTSGYKSNYGTFKVEAAGTWQSCDAGDLDNQAVSPCQNTSNGDWTDLSNGRIDITVSGTEIGKAMLLPSSAGGKVIIIDTKNVPTVQGPGLLVGVKRQDISGVDLGGTYTFNDDDGGYGNVTVTNDTNSYTGTHYDSSGASTAISGTLTRNDPWTGWLRNNTEDAIILILPDDGVWFQTQREPNNDWISIGGAIP